MRSGRRNKVVRVEPFGRELSLIVSSELREFVRECLRAAPAYFWWVPASFSGHHPAFARSQGGLVRHTKAAVVVFLDLAEAVGCGDRDACLAALILHDTLKCGVEPPLPPRTVPEHPLLPESYYEGFGLKGLVAPEVWEAVFSRVRSHMGRWGPVMPSTRDQWLVHLADYVASRGWAGGLAETIEEGRLCG
ncbi:MAG: HD domain-containing protein [Moorellales bacterium]